jgi:hypothetical protein
MRNLLFLFFFVLTGRMGQAQTFDEWFRQNETQRKYLIEQIAAFKVYLGYVQKGYAIAQKGLTAISDIKKGDFDLHRDFFGALKEINPKISRYAKVADIVSFQLKILELYRDLSRQIKTMDLLDALEADYILSVFQNLLNDCSAIIIELTVVITPGELEMKDDERLFRIDALYTRMQEAYTFAQGFGTETKLLALQRIRDSNDIQISRGFNGIKNK